MAHLVTYFLTAIGLAMDAFAAAVCKGLSMKKVKIKNAIILGFAFGLFQAIMPLIGWAVGRSLEQYIKNLDHWIAFVLLAFIGGRMLFESLSRSDDKSIEYADELNLKEVLVLAIATSIDALAVGVTFACLAYDIGIAALIIGLMTFALSLAGVYIGNVFGAKDKRKAEFCGGAILILIGLKILLEHLGIIN